MDCPSCGYVSSMDCPSCGYVMRPGESECRRCRWKPGESAAAPPSPAPPPSVLRSARPVPAQPDARRAAASPPQGIVIAVTLIVIVAILQLLGGLGGLALIAVAPAGMRAGPLWSAWVPLWAVGMILLGCGGLVACHFLWRGRQWAWWLVIALTGIGVFSPRPLAGTGGIARLRGGAVLPEHAGVSRLLRSTAPGDPGRLNTAGATGACA